MDDLADLLMRFEDRPILNKTNLKGLYDIRLQWNPLPPGVEPGARNAGERIVNADVATLPTLFTALEEQLGLKLESRKGQVETIVIDHLERPSPN
jgi:uncharacterized protein (TIGR03435 family)